MWAEMKAPACSGHAFDGDTLEMSNESAMTRFVYSVACFLATGRTIISKITNAACKAATSKRQREMLSVLKPMTAASTIAQGRTT